MVREYKSWGLDVDLEEAGTLPVGFNRGPWFGRMLGENSMHLHFVTPSYTSGTKGAQAGSRVILRDWAGFRTCSTATAVRNHR